MYQKLFVGNYKKERKLIVTDLPKEASV